MRNAILILVLTAALGTGNAALPTQADTGRAVVTATTGRAS